ASSIDENHNMAKCNSDMSRVFSTQHFGEVAKGQFDMKFPPVQPPSGLAVRGAGPTCHPFQPPLGAVHNEMDLSQALLQDRVALQDAIAGWCDTLKMASGDYRTTFEATFAPNIRCTQDFHLRVTSMGVNIVETSKAGVAIDVPQLPYAAVGGDIASPCIIITWKLKPPEEKTTIHLYPSKGRLVVKAKRGALEGRAQLFLAFFGPCVDLASSAPAKAKMLDGQMDLLAMMQAK
ncbi:unnamed protein product, partial [Polarella glacialis]